MEGSSSPTLTEAVASGPQVGATWRRIGRALGGCGTTTFALGGRRYRATVHSLSLPRVGSAFSAYAWAFSIAGVRVGVDLVLFRVGGYGVYVAYGDLGPPETSTVEAFVRAAAAKARTGSTARVPAGVSIASAPVRTVHTGLGTVAYREVGSGPPLVLVMGYGGGMETWDRRLVDALAQQHRVVTFDNAGVGGTAPLPAPLGIDAMASQTSALIGALGLKRPDVLGWSMGSMVAQALAVLHPGRVRRLVLCAAFPGDGGAVTPSRRVLDDFESGDPARVMPLLFPAGRTAAQNTYLAALSAYPTAAPVAASTLAAQRRAVDAWWGGHDPAGRRTAEIAAPTLVADGAVDRLDPAANSRTLARQVRGAALALYPGAGHAFLFQDLTSFAARVEAFLGS